jgi:DNA-directed RNA polymerase specialized sigma24 family protein
MHFLQPQIYGAQRITGLIEQPERSPDLEWMLQSGETSRAMVTRYLLEAYFGQIWTLALMYFQDAEMARGLVKQTFAAALQDDNRYQGETSVAAWIYAIAVRLIRRPKSALPVNPGEDEQTLALELPEDPQEARLWQAISALDDGDRLVLLMTHLPSLPRQDAITALGVGEQDLDRRIENAFQALSDHFARLGGGPSELRHMDAFFVQSVEQRWGAIRVSPGRLDRLAIEIQGLAEQKTTRARQLKRVRDVVMLGALLALVVVLVRFYDVLIPGVEIPYYEAEQSQVEATLEQINPNELALESPSFSSPLTAASSPQLVMFRIIQSHHLWENLWADAEVQVYNSDDMDAPPVTYRNQLLVSKPEQALIYAGPLEGDPDYIRVLKGSSSLEVDLRKGIAYRVEITHSALTSLAFPTLHIDDNEGSDPYGFFLADLVLPRRSRTWSQGELVVVRDERVAGRPAVVVDWVPTRSRGAPARFWIDGETGVILGQKQFSRRLPGVVIWEASVKEIHFDVTYPPEVFNVEDIWSNGLAWEDVWKPASVLSQPVNNAQTLVDRMAHSTLLAPVDMDFSNSRLTFHWNLDVDKGYSPHPVATLFANGFYLGQVALGNPWEMVCQRSPDGRLIAFTEKSDPELRLFSLDALHTVRHLLPEGVTGLDFSFSPDSRSLAFLGCLSESGCGVYLHDLQTQEDRLLYVLASESPGDGPDDYEAAMGIHLKWSSDGQRLTLVTLGQGSNPEAEVLVIDKETNENLYRTAVNLKKLGLPAKPIVQNSDGSLQTESSGLEACAYPPGG